MPDGMSAPRAGSNQALHLRLMRLNHARMAPGLPSEDWRRDIERQARQAVEEGEFLEASRSAVADRAGEAPHDADGFIRWFEQLEHDGPGQHDRLFGYLAESATREEMCWFLTQEVAGEAGFEDLSALTQMRMPVQVKLEIARNYWDEMGRGNEKGMHGPMLETLALRLGLAPNPDDTVWEALALANTMAGLAANRRYAYHSVGALGVVEQPKASSGSASLPRTGITSICTPSSTSSTPPRGTRRRSARSCRATRRSPGRSPKAR